VAEVLDRRLHALWDPAGAADRLATASEIIELARTTGDGARERRALFWRFVALMELGRVAEAESALAVFEREAAAAGDAPGAVTATARQAMLAVLRGRFEEAERLAAEVAEAGRRAGVADAERLAGTLRGQVAAERDPSTWPVGLELFQALARRQPGHFYETTAARILVALDREAEAATELQRILLRVMAGSGPRWLGAVTDLAVVAAATGTRPPRRRCTTRLGPTTTGWWSGAALSPPAGRCRITSACWRSGWGGSTTPSATCRRRSTCRSVSGRCPAWPTAWPPWPTPWRPAATLATPGRRPISGAGPT
jgi:hypothetical protein